MTLKEHIEDISNQLKQGAFANEAAVSFGIIHRILEVLGWPKYTPQVIIPEYGVGGQRVDFALCHPPGKPLVFIEVKQVGNLDGAEDQLFGYAFREGVPIAILTDGQKWRFFHSTGEGRYRDRKVYELDLIEGDIEEGKERLDRYLNYSAIQNGDAVNTIKIDYQNVSKQREIEARLPEFWNELLQEKNEYLLLAVMEKAKNKVGHEPTVEQVVVFLKNLSVPSVKPTFVTNVVSKKLKQNNKKIVIKKLIVTMPDGKIIDHHHGKKPLLRLLKS